MVSMKALARELYLLWFLFLMPQTLQEDAVTPDVYLPLLQACIRGGNTKIRRLEAFIGCYTSIFPLLSWNASKSLPEN